MSTKDRRANRETERDELDLEAETIGDLDVKEQEGEQVRGGYTSACAQSNRCLTN
jgi:hypothetical protein